MKDTLNLIKGTAVFAVQAVIVSITFIVVISIFVFAMNMLANLIF